MIKINVHIYNENEATDSDVFVQIQLPFVPRVGEFVILTDEERDELIDKIKKSPNRENYYDLFCHPTSEYFRKDEYYKLKDSDFENIDIDGMYEVSQVFYSSNVKIVSIELKK